MLKVRGVWQTVFTLVSETVIQLGSPHHHLINPDNGLGRKEPASYKAGK